MSVNFSSNLKTESWALNHKKRPPNFNLDDTLNLSKKIKFLRLVPKKNSGQKAKQTNKGIEGIS